MNRTDGQYKNTLAKIFKNAGIERNQIRKLVSALTEHDQYVFELAKYLCEDYISSGGTARLKNRQILARLILAFAKECRDAHVGFFSVSDTDDDESKLKVRGDDYITIYYMESEEDKINNIIFKISATTGSAIEFPKEQMHRITDQENSYGAFKFKKFDKDVLTKMKRLIPQLRPELRFSIFTERANDGIEVDVLHKTAPLPHPKGEADKSYSVPRLISAMIGCALLDSGKEKQYQKIEAEKQKHINDLLIQFCDSEDEIYVAPVFLQNKNSFILYSDEIERVNSNFVSTDDFKTILTDFSSGFNVVPQIFTEEEMENFPELENLIQKDVSSLFCDSSLLREYLKFRMLHIINDDPDRFLFNEENLGMKSVLELKSFPKNVVADLMISSKENMNSVLFEDEKITECEEKLVRAMEKYELIMEVEPPKKEEMEEERGKNTKEKETEIETEYDNEPGEDYYSSDDDYPEL